MKNFIRALTIVLLFFTAVAGTVVYLAVSAVSWREIFCNDMDIDKGIAKLIALTNIAVLIGIGVWAWT